MAENRSTMTFEEFTQSMMRVIDRALETNRASENQLMRESRGLCWAAVPAPSPGQMHRKTGNSLQTQRAVCRWP